ncbi:unnamed protein product [Blepharisma stoltei]|uniref:MIR domain-containing protein n=1 Tax=Blepharisma stoltei TaxID=1481888 RepID=A0AAU9JQT3_9CILI|nr:unnamed protein product [Blepharisma stoltei]
MDETQLKESIVYGSLISLKTIDNCYAYSQGFVDTTIYLQEASNISFSEAVFRICPQSIFTTQQEVLRLISEGTGPSVAERVDLLNDSLDDELKTNVHIYSNFKGVPVKYGSLIQLEHVQSHRFVTVHNRQSSNIERQNIKISLEDYPSEFSHFRVEACFKCQKEGKGIVRSGDKVALEFTILDLGRNACLHSSIKGINPSNLIKLLAGDEFDPSSLSQEMDGSLDQMTAWIIELNSPFVNEVSESLMCGDIIWLSHAEEYAGLGGILHKNHLEVLYNKNLNDTNCLWMIEGENSQIGGKVKIGTKYRLKHISTKKYLTIQNNHGINSPTNVLTGHHNLSLADITKGNNLWTFEHIDEGVKSDLINGQFCKIVNCDNESSIAIKQVKGGWIKPAADFVHDEMSYFKIKKANQEVIWETLFLLNCYPILKNFPNYLKNGIQLNETENPDEVKNFENCAILVAKCIADVDLFCKNKLRSMVGTDKKYGEVQHARQRMIKEQRIFDVVIEILDATFRTEFETSIVKKLTTDTWKAELDITAENSKIGVLNAEDSVNVTKTRYVINIVERIYDLLVTLCYKNLTNQMYAFNYLNIFVKHIEYNLGATKFLLSILKSNNELLFAVHKVSLPQQLFPRQMVDSSLISYYSSLLCSQHEKRRPQILEFLKTICSYKDHRIKVNQKKIFELVFMDKEIYASTLIQIQMKENQFWISSDQSSELNALDTYFDDGHINKESALIVYFIKLLELFGALCFGRNTLFIDALKEDFPGDILQNIMWNPKLTKALRAAASKLMFSMHIDVFPRMEIKKPEFVKIIRMGESMAGKKSVSQKWSSETEQSFVEVRLLENTMINLRDELETAKTNIERASIDIGDLEEADVRKFTDENSLIQTMLYNILEFFSTQRNGVQYDIFVDEMLRVSEKLIKFNLYGTCCTNFDKQFTIVNPLSIGFSSENMDIVRLLRSISHLLFFTAERRRSSIKKRGSLKRRKSSRRSEDREDEKDKDKKNYLEELLNDPAELSEPVTRCAVNLKNFISILKSSSFQDHVKKTPEDKIKVRICKILNLYLDIQMEFLINNVLGWFNHLTYSKDWIYEDLSILFPPIMKISHVSHKATNEFQQSNFKTWCAPVILNLNCMSSEPILPKLLNVFVESKNYKLKQNILALIMRCFRQRTDMLHALKKLHVVCNLQEALIYKYLKKSMAWLKQYADQNEVWLTYWKDDSLDKAKAVSSFENVNELLQNIDYILFEETSIQGNTVTPGRCEKVSKSRQTIFFYLKIHELLLHFLKDGMYVLLLNQDKNKDSECFRKIHNLFTICHNILIKFVYNNPKNLKWLNWCIKEAKFHKNLPLFNILDILLQLEDGKNSSVPMKLPALEFFYHIYIESEEFNDEIKSSESFHLYITRQAEVLEIIAVVDEDHTNFLATFLKVLFHYSITFFRPEIPFAEQESSSSLHQFAKSLAKNISKFDSRFVKQPMIDQIHEFCSSFSCEINDAIGESREVAREALIDSGNSLFDDKEWINEAEEGWKNFIENVLYSENIKKILADEKKALRLAIYYINNFHPNLAFTQISKEIINFISGSRNQRVPVGILIESIELLGSFIEESETEESENSVGLEITKEEMQNKFNSFGATNVCLTLLCDLNTEKPMFVTLIHFLTQLLDGGNRIVQAEIYKFFANNPTSENLFKRMHTELIDRIETITNGPPPLASKKAVYKEDRDIIKLILRLLQLFCENHNSKLQVYLRFQTHSMNSYDMINDVTFLLESLMKKMHINYFLEISQCFDTLTEFIQGPCKNNQEYIIDGQFVEIASNLLAIDEYKDGIEVYEALKNEKIYDKFVTNQVECLKGWMISHLKYKCMITILALLEARNDNYVISRLIRAFHTELLKENLISIFKNYVELYGIDHYDYDIFNHTAENEEYESFGVRKQDQDPKYYTLVIEVGMMIYQLMKMFRDSDETNEEMEEGGLPPAEELPELNMIFGGKLLGGLGRFGMAFVKNSLETVTKLAKIVDNEGGKQAEEDSAEVLEAAYKFFDGNTTHIEIVFNEEIIKYYFTKPPIALGYTNELKEEFSADADRTSTQTKLTYLTNQSDRTIEQLQHEHFLQKLYNRNKFTALFVSNVYLYRELSFMITLVLNFFIISSYSDFVYEQDNNLDEDKERLWRYSLFYYDAYNTEGGLNYVDTKSLMIIFGTVQVVLSALIVSFFLLQKGPYLAKTAWRRSSPDKKFWSSNPKKLIVIYIRGRQLLFTLFYSVTVDVVYYSAYMIFSILGLSYHPFFFCFLLSDILYKYPSLQNVIKSVILPWKSLVVLFIFLIVLIYLFGVWAYIGFPSDLSGNCVSLLKCGIFIGDRGFKANGGIGGWISDWGAGWIDYDRLFFDNSFNILIMIIALKIVQGVIIDTFTILREQQEESTNDKENKCFICGLDRDEIEHFTGRPFAYHVYTEHNEWNYILFIAYLKSKDETEYSGIESYVKEQYDKKELLWFPQSTSLAIKKNKTLDEVKRQDMFKTIEQRIEYISTEFEKLKALKSKK